MRVLPIIFLFAFAATGSGSLLEMSRTLWTKVLEGGLTKIGALDPLRVPVVKVDQSEGNTSYRMILRSLEIIGLNSSTLESVHVGRGRLRSNLSEHEAGYVSYTDQRELDTIRYRFHTVVKEPKGERSENLEVKSIPDLDNSNNGQGQYGRVRTYDRTNYESSSRYQDDRRRTGPQGQGSNYESTSRYQEDRQRTMPRGQGSDYESSSRYQGDRQRTMPQGQGSNYESSSRYQEDQQRPVSRGQGSNYESSPRYQENQQRPVYRGQGSNYDSSSRYQADQRRTMPQGQRSNYEGPIIAQDQGRYYSQPQNSRRPSDESKVDYQGSQDKSSAYTASRSSVVNDGQGSDGPGTVRIVYAERLRTPEESSETRNQRPMPSCVGSCQYRRRQGNSEVQDRRREGVKEEGQNDEIGVAASGNFESRSAYVEARVAPSRNQDSVKGRTRYDSASAGENRYAASFERKSDGPSDDGKYQGYTSGPSERLENQSDYVDIVYADEKDNRMRHFGNLRVEQGKDKTVYSLEDVLRVIEYNHFID